jgi:hypothetical protein
MKILLNPTHGLFYMVPWGGRLLTDLTMTEFQKPQNTNFTRECRKSESGKINVFLEVKFKKLSVDLKI